MLKLISRLKAQIGELLQIQARQRGPSAPLPHPLPAPSSRGEGIRRQWCYKQDALRCGLSQIILFPAGMRGDTVAARLAMLVGSNRTPARLTLNQTRRMNSKFTFTVNGQSRTVSSDPQRPLLDVLREDLQLTGTKYGCGEGQCRACTVLINGKASASCVTPISEADKQTIITIEGLAEGDKLHPVQEAFLAEGAFQCGYCTPGMILGVVGLLNELPHPSDDDILPRMQRHLCRCCHYPKLLKAIRRAAGQTAKPATPK